MSIETINSPSGDSLATDVNVSPLPLVHFDNITLDSPPSMSTGETKISQPLVTTLKLHLEIPVESDSVIDINNIVDNLSIFLISSQSAKNDRQLERGSIPADVKRRQLPLASLVDIAELEHKLEKKIFTTSSSGQKFLEIFFEISETTLSTPEHLSYYACTHLDMGDILEAVGLDQPGFSYYSGMSAENVIKEGKVNTTAFVFIITSPGPNAGSYWTGPVMKKPNGSWMTAKLSVAGLVPTQPPSDLERRIVSNSTIHDLRVAQTIPSLNIDLKPAKMFPLTIKGNNRFDNSTPTPDAYISNAFLSRDMHNNCRFIFEFDYHGFLVAESQFGKMLTNPFVPLNTKKKIYAYSRITNLQIIRRQVEVARSYNRLSSPILGISRSQLDPEEVLIVETSSDKTKNNLLSTVVAYAPGNANGMPNSQVGTIMEYPLISGSPRETRTILVTDNSVQQLTDGTYQYGTQIEVEDGTVKFLNDRILRLIRVKEYLVEYLHVLERPTGAQQNNSAKYMEKYYDLYFGKQDRQSNIDAIEINNLRNEVGMPVGNLDSRSILYPWILATEYYVDTLQAISDFKEAPANNVMRSPDLIRTPAAILEEKDKKRSPSDSLAVTPRYESSVKPGEIRNALKNLLDPANASPETILQVLSLYDYLLEKVRAMLGHNAQMYEPPRATKMLGVSKNYKVTLLSLKDYFVELYDAQLSTYPAVDYIGFMGSPGSYMPQSPPQDTQFQISPTANTNAFENPAPDTSQNSDNVPGLLGLSADDFDTRLEDEKQMAEQLGGNLAPATTGNASQATPGPSDKKDKLQKLKDRKEEKQANKAANDMTPTTSTSAAPTALGANSATTAAPTLPTETQEEATPSSPPGGGGMMTTYNSSTTSGFDKAPDNNNISSPSAPATLSPPPMASAPTPAPLFLSPSVLDSKEGLVIERSSVAGETWNPAAYEDLQTLVVGKSLGRAFPSADAGVDATFDGVMGALNITPQPNKSPMSVEISLRDVGQGSPTDVVPAREIFGNNSRQIAGHQESSPNQCIPGAEAGAGNLEMEMCEQRSNARPITQGFMDVVARNGALSQVRQKADGNPQMLGKIYDRARSNPQARNKLQQLAQRGGTPAQYKKYAEAQLAGKGPLSRGESGAPAMKRFAVDMLAKIMVFDGYAADSAGNFMIKRPVFRTLDEVTWKKMLLQLKNPNNNIRALLCKVEPAYDPSLEIGTVDGLQLVSANSYFLITQNSLALVDIDDVLGATQYSREFSPMKTRTPSPRAVRSIVVNTIPDIRSGLGGK